MRLPFGLAPLTAWLLVLGTACFEPRQPVPDPHVLDGHDDQPPACITTALEARYQACPSPRRPAPRPVCRSRSPETEPERAELPPLAAPEHPSPALARAEALLAEPLPGDEREANDHRRRVRRTLEQAIRAERGVEAAYARLRLAELLLELDDPAAAMAERRAAALMAAKASALPRARAIADHAQRGYVALYARLGDATKADEDFAPLAPYGKTAALLSQLADTLAASGRSHDLEAVMRQLASRDPDHRCRHRARILDLARSAGDRDATILALNGLLEAYDELPLHAPDRDACVDRTARHLLELAASYEREATTESATTPSATQAESLDLAEQLYRRVLASFTEEQLARHGICVSLADVAHRRGALTFRQGRWRDCGAAFDLALQLDPNASWAATAAHTAMVCRQNAWTATSDAHDHMTDHDRMEGALAHTDDWRRMLAAFHRYLCTSDLGPEQAASSDAAFDRAQAFLDGGALWESAVGFRVVAFAGGPSAPRAMRRYAEVTASLAADDTCRIELRRDLEHLMRRHCEAQDSDDCRSTRATHKSLEPLEL
ncbi:MAG: hypothetical protein R3B72_50040 [Polyangiaceae bacterium]